MLNLQCFSIKQYLKMIPESVVFKKPSHECLGLKSKTLMEDLLKSKYCWQSTHKKRFILVICRFAVDSAACVAYVAKCAVERVSAPELKPRPLRSTAIRRTAKQVPPCPWDPIPRIGGGLPRTKKYRYGCIGPTVCKERWKREIIQHWVFLFMSAYV